MPQDLDAAKPERKNRFQWLLRLLGLALLLALLLRLDMGRVLEVLGAARLPLIVLALFGILPLIFIKTLRWLMILRAQNLRMGLWPAFAAYFGSLFIGFLTPGRLGEFIKAVYVSHSCDVSAGQAFSSVLADRLFDLYLLLIVGSIALLNLVPGQNGLLVVGGVLLVAIIPLVIYLNDASYTSIRQLAERSGRLGKHLFASGSWLSDMRVGLLSLDLPALGVAVLLTLLAYGVYFGQCYLLALSLSLPISWVLTTYAIALGSLVTLVPVSISGIGTRDAAIIAYLGTAGVAGEQAIGFSFLVFLTFYIAGGAVGAVAFLLRPVPLPELRKLGK